MKNLISQKRVKIEKIEKREKREKRENKIYSKF